jgi:exodeoxyribonuclease VII large subunit
MISKENIFTVSEINRHIKNVVESNIPQLFIEGEISNFKHHSSGHIYFSLKDNYSSIRCVFFSSYNKYLKIKPKNGDKVICGGKITVYEVGGSYQLNVTKLIPSGIGELQLKFEELKEKLNAEGLFDSIHKKQIPRYPEEIGVITSETGAALQDIKNVLSRRFPCKVHVFPSIVQGKTAAKSIIKGLEYFKEHPVDLILIARGGGSQEDLFCFNDEQLAREIFRSDIPIISGVGHEIDFTIADFVADLRAPTPSAAAELASPNKTDIIQYLDEFTNRLDSILLNRLQFEKMYVQKIEKKLNLFHPEIKFYELKNLLNIYTERLINFPIKVHAKDEHIEKLTNQIIIKLSEKMEKRIGQEKNKINDILGKLQKLCQNKLDENNTNLRNIKEKLLEFSPENALKRGYGIVRKEKKLVNSINQVNISDKINIILKDGNLDCLVTKKNESTIL